MTTTNQISMARLLASQTAFAIECDGVLVGYDRNDTGHCVIQNGATIISARPAEVILMQDPAQLAIVTNELTVFVDITRRLRETLLGLYGGVCQ